MKGGLRRSANPPPSVIYRLSSTLPLLAPGCLVVYVVLLDDLLVLYSILAHPDLLLGHWTLLDHYLFLGDGHADLVFADLGLRDLPALLHGHTIHVHLFAPLWHPQLLAICPHPLADVEATGLALTGAGSKLLFCSLHPELVLVFEVVLRLGDALGPGVVPAELAALSVAHSHARVSLAGSLVGFLAVVLAVGAPLLRALHALKPVVAADLVLVLGSDLPVVVKGRTVLGLALLHRNLDAASLF